MCPVSNKARYDCYGGLKSENRAAGNDPEQASKEIDLIKTANKKLKLSAVLKRYNINFDQNNRFNAWSQLITCPFSNHKGGNERTPSFGYNFNDDRFNCFGCGCAGRAVEFIAYKEKREKISVAEQIIIDFGSYQDEETEEEEQEDIDDALFKISAYLQTLTQKYKNNKSAIKKIESYHWWLDHYIYARAPKHDIVNESLKDILNKLKEKLTYILEDY